MKNKLISTGIVVEYNPFHNGHIHHIQSARKITQCDVLIAVMSPQFTQRGEPAFIDKKRRTLAALEHGVDIVLELPSYYALQAADYFATASIEILNLAAIDHLVYGVEKLDTNPSEFNLENMVKGHSYAASFMNDDTSPNNILAHAYEKVLENYPITGHRIQRTNSYLGLDISNTISSATAIRHAHSNGISTTHTTPMNFDQTHHLNDYEDLIRYALISSSAEELRDYLLVDEGIEYLLKKHQDKPLDELIEACISKRYTRSRIQRTLLNILLKHRKDTPASLKQARILGFTPQGQEYLKQIKGDEETLTPSFKSYVNKDLEAFSSSIYALPYNQAYYDEIMKLELTGPIQIKP